MDNMDDFFGDDACDAFVAGMNFDIDATDADMFAAA